MEKREPLKPCPFCGGKAIQEPYSESLKSMQHIRCEGCGIMTGFYSVSHGGDPAIAWQARTSEAS